MTFGSLFAGIGGIDLGLERAGLECKWQVEIDDYAQAILEKHWPQVPKYRDVRYFLGSKRWRQARSAWGVDCIAGGFPCQDISNAGNRVGIDGPRSGLWSELARIVRLLRPRYVLVENVDALAVRGLGRVLGDLAALGYDAEWERIPAVAVGAPHLRWRIFIVAYPCRDQISLSDSSSGPDKDSAATRKRPSSNFFLPKPGGLFAGQLWREQFEAFCEETRSLYWKYTIAPVCRVADGVPHRMERIRGLGNAVVPQIAEWIGRRIMQANSESDKPKCGG